MPIPRGGCRIAIAGIFIGFMVGCVPQQTMPETDGPLADVAHSNKAIVIVGSRGGADSHHSSETIDVWVNQDLRSPAPNGVVRNLFNEWGPTRAYAVDPGSYWLSEILWVKQHLQFEQANTPARFTVAAGDVIYLGEIHVTEEIGALGTSGCILYMKIRFFVADTLDGEWESINRILDSKYPGAKERLRRSLMHVLPVTLPMVFKNTKPCMP